jgi:hypothetical protein
VALVSPLMDEKTPTADAVALVVREMVEHTL